VKCKIGGSEFRMAWAEMKTLCEILLKLKRARDMAEVVDLCLSRKEKVQRMLGSPQVHTMFWSPHSYSSAIVTATWMLDWKYSVSNSRTGSFTVFLDSQVSLHTQVLEHL
jgi:hypothetical protein